MLVCLKWRTLIALAGGLCVAVTMTSGNVWAEFSAGLREDPEIHAEEGDRLFRFLASAASEDQARAVEAEIWSHWLEAPDTASAGMMERALERRRNHDIGGAIAILDDLVVMTPEWAEAWNQRATMLFFNGDYEASMEDIGEVLALEPRHFGALAGKAMILLRQGRGEEAQETLKAAVAINPWLRERALIVEEPGKDI